MSKNRQTVEIFGQQYSIIGKASPGQMRSLASQVDESMRKVAKGNPRLDLTRVAVLSAVNFADSYNRLKQEYDEIIHLIEDVEP